MSVDVNDVEAVNNLTQYDAVVLGSAVYLGKWLESAQRFVTDHADELATCPTWLFSSGPTGDPPRPTLERAVSIDAITASITPKEHRLFPGKLDHHQLSFPERAVARRLAGRHRARLRASPRRRRARPERVQRTRAIHLPRAEHSDRLIGTIVLALLVMQIPLRRAVHFKPGEALRYA